MVSERTPLQPRLVVALLAMLLSLPVVAGQNQQLRDPTQSPSQRPSPQTDDGQAKSVPTGHGRHWRLQAVFIQPSQRLAVASGRTLTIGQRIEDVRVLAIETDHVLLADADGEFRLHWPGHQRITSTEESPQ